MDNLDGYIYGITAFLPLAASMLVFQTNPYHALVIRGILGAITALVYAVLGAADVALTEALVGTLLAVMLYAVAVRSSLVLRLGVLKDDLIAAEEADPDQPSHFKQQLTLLRTLASQYHLRVELVPYLNQVTLEEALINQEIHVTCAQPGGDRQGSPPQSAPYQMTTRLRRIYEILQTNPMLSPNLIDVKSGNAREVRL